MQINMNLKILLSFLLMFISSCSSSFVTTNLDKENFSTYFSAANVKVFKSAKEIKSSFELMGIVEGQDCQLKPHHAVPDKINARTQARRKAANLKANGIVFTSCVLLSQSQLEQLNNNNPAQQCHAMVICYGKAYAIDVLSKKHD